jgi:ABC-type Fe3+ transport system substrate-binding protein
MAITEVDTQTTIVDEAKAEAFADQIADVLNNGALSLGLSIGHRTRLFDTLADLPPATSQEIADAADLNERYVREWLGAMVTGGIITYNTGKETYELPPEHAASLTRAASPNNMDRQLRPSGRRRALFSLSALSSDHGRRKQPIRGRGLDRHDRSLGARSSRQVGPRHRRDGPGLWCRKGHEPVGKDIPQQPLYWF